jgi:transposase
LKADSVGPDISGDDSMMGRQTADQRALFYEFNLDERVPADHLLRRIDIFVRAALANLHEALTAYYSHTGRPSIDPELLIRMLIVGYCYGVRSERRLCEEVALNLSSDTAERIAVISYAR